MSLKRDLLKGVGYTAISKYIGIIISLVVTGILSRLLTPTEFGVIAVAMVIITFFGILSDLGIAPAIIQHKDLDEKDLSNLFAFTVWLSIGISLFFFLSSGVIASYYNSPVLSTICRILSLSLLFNTINIVPNALLYKDKAFKFLAQRTIIVQSVVGAIAILAALYGAGIYALLINPVLSAIIIFIITFRRYPQRLHRTFGLTSLKKIFSFSAYQFLFNLINYFSRNLDKLLIGRYMGMSPLGYYEKSYRLMMLPLQNITHVITPVMHPLFSDFQNDLDKLESSYRKVVRLLAFIGFPLSIFLLFTSRELILLIFGMQWEASVPVFRILSLTVGTQIILSTSGSIFQAANDTKSLFICGVFSALMNVGGMLIGLFVFKSLNAVAWSILITFSINLMQAYIQMYYVTFKLPIKPFLRMFVSPFILSVAVFLVFILYSSFVHIENLMISFTIKGLLFFIIYGSYVQLTKEYDIIKKLKGILK
jgi:teichuronic acid exporter